MPAMLGRRTRKATRRRGRALLWLLVLPIALAAAPRAFAADPPSADEIIAQMKAALEPAKSSIRRMQMTVKQQGETRTFALVQARKALPDGERSLTVLLAPDDAKGLAYLVAKKPRGQDNLEWLYIPVVRRVRQLVPAENYTSFLDTDFTYGDLGFLDANTTNKLLGSDTVGGKKVFKIDSVPGSTTKQWYYSHVVTTVDATTLLPVKREFYSPSNMLYKVETYENVSRVDGIPTPFQTTMQTLPANTSTQISVSEISYGVDIPDTLFGPDDLRKVADLAFWGQPQKTK